MGVYWLLWGIGWILVVITRCVLNTVRSNYNEHIADKSKVYQIVTISLMCLCIALVGGIANGLWMGSILGNVVGLNFGVILVALGFFGSISSCLTWFVGYLVLGVYKESRKWVIAIFVIVFIASIILWTIPITNYNQNIEYKEETGVSSTQEYNLYYFCNIPVQHVSGKVDGSSFFGTGSVAGKISTSEELPYWYDDGSGEALYASVSADDAKICFIQDGETPFVRIITHSKKEIKRDNNVGEETVTDETYWTTYEFHLPKEVMQYNIG